MASSSGSTENKFKYEVFLSFRGEDTRKNFVDHLYHALHNKGIITYKDDVTLRRGKKISDELLQSIEDSKFYLIVFSKNYASSSWCLNELVKIMECNKNAGHTVYPVFYDVEPTKVRNQGGKHGQVPAKYTEEEVRKWRQALTEAGNLAGFVLENNDDGHQAKFIKRIVDRIFLDLGPINMHFDKTMVGMERRMKTILSSLEIGIDEVRMIGISGIGGSGKTALARAVFNEISNKYEGISFVENIREVSKTFGLTSLQNQVISDVSNERNIYVTSVDNGKNVMMRLLQGKKVLIVLDDVDHIDQLMALAGEPNWFKAGSRFIITTRNQQVLKAHGVIPIHEVELLSDIEAACLFHSYAFGRDIQNCAHEKLCSDFVSYACGLPLVIRVLGLALYGKEKVQWIDQLKRLKNTPMREPLERLELSFSCLEYDYKDIFLDVACFLIGKQKDDAIRTLESCGFSAISGLDDLELKSLITISDDQHLGMHGLIQDMGRYIVRRSYPYDPEKHTRLWEREKVEEILANGLDNVETSAIALDDHGSDIFANGFGNIKRLRFLRMVSKNDENTHQINQNFPYKLQYLSWEFYPYWSLPITFQATHLVALELSNSRIEKLWDGDKKQALEKLRFLVLSHSRLTYLDLDLTPNLERLDLEECQHLNEIQMVNASLQKLVFLNLTGCSRIGSLVFIKRLESLKVLHLSCLSLEMFPDIIPGPGNNSLLELLHFRFNNIEELPASIGNLKNLVYLNLHFAGRVRSLPESICGLLKLKDLDLYCCTLEELPDDIGLLECLEMLNLSRALIKQLPDTICRLKKLTILDLSYCFDLEKLPEDIGQLECLEELILTRCGKIREIPGSFCRLKKLTILDLSYCFDLEKLPEDIGQLECLEELILTRCGKIREIPGSFCRMKKLKCFCLLDCIELKRLPDGLELIVSLEELHVKGTHIKIPQSILSLQGLKIDETSSSLGTLKASSTIKKQKCFHK